MKHEISFPEWVDSTTLSAYKGCPKQFEWAHLHHLAPLTPNVHLAFGATLAEALAAAKQLYFVEHQDAETSILHGFEVLLCEWPREIPLDGLGTVKSFDRLAAAYMAYFEDWPLDEDPLTPWEGMIEYSFTIPLPVAHPETGDPILYCGRFDSVCRDPEGNLWVVDEKTTSQMGPKWNQQWDLRGQFLGYVWACREQEIPVKGCIVRGIAIKKTGIETSGDVPITFSPRLIDDWERSTVAALEKAKADYLAGFFPGVYDNACTAYGGCTFRQLCMANDPWEWIPHNYSRRVWNPIAHREIPLEEDRP